MASKKKKKVSKKKVVKKKPSKKKVSRTASRTRRKATAKRATPATGRSVGNLSMGSAKDISPVSQRRPRAAEYGELFDQMKGMDPNDHDAVLKAYPPEGVSAATFQARVNSAMLATDFQRPKNCTYYKRICKDDKGREYLAISITKARNYA